MGFPTRYRAERFSGRKPISRGSLHSVSGPNASRVLQNLSSTCLVVSLVELTVLVFALNPYSLMMSDACLKSGSVPKCCQV